MRCDESVTKSGSSVDHESARVRMEDVQAGGDRGWRAAAGYKDGRGMERERMLMVTSKEDTMLSGSRAANQGRHTPRCGSMTGEPFLWQLLISLSVDLDLDHILTLMSVHLVVLLFYAASGNRC